MMKIIFLVLLIILICYGCTSFDGHKETHTKHTVKLMKESELLDNTKVILFKRDSFVVHAPLISLMQYSSFKNEKLLNLFCLMVDSLIKLPNKNKLYEITLEILPNNRDRYFNTQQFFESGSYMIYNKKSKQYINEVIIAIDQSYHGPLSGYLIWSVYIGDYVFWEDGWIL